MKTVIRSLLLVAAVAAGTVQLAAQTTPAKSGARPRSFTLYRSPGDTIRARIAVNEMSCDLNNAGSTCIAGIWPKQTQNKYMFDAGIQVFGIIPSAPGCTAATRSKSNTPECFVWSGDTTGAMLWDETGNLRHASPVTPLYNSKVQADLNNWPAPGTVPNFPAVTAFLTDTAIFDETLIGRKTISEHDLWSAYWDGATSDVSAGGRSHPMGVLVEHRTLAWNYPTGNEATIYNIFRITNITNNIQFQQNAEAVRFGGLDSIPNAGWRLDSVYIVYDADPDVGPATNNQITAVLPLSTMLAYETSFSDPAMTYASEQFHPPFLARAPGFAGMSFARTPTDATGSDRGLTAFSRHTNAFPPPNSVGRGWRQAALGLSPAYMDASCSLPLAEVRARRICYAGQVRADIQGYIATGPFSLEPGQSETVIVAVFAAAVVATPAISAAPTADNAPGIPSLAPGCTEPVRPIELAAGFVAPRACPTPGTVMDPSVMSIVPGSALGKALVARSIAHNKFVMPSAPEAPMFAVEPGNNSVTVTWEPSATDVNGDRWFAIASDSTRGLLDPNYRQFDVEGYRIYRGTTPANMKLIAQFDKQGTEFVDALCVTDGTHVTGTPCSSVARRPLSGAFIQFNSVVATSSGTPLVLRADTTSLSDTGIPYRFTDTGLRNGFTYYYKVTAFDINSIRSAPSSLESEGAVKQTIPRAALSADNIDLSKVHTVPDPFYATSLFDRGPTRKEIQFVNLPARAVVRVYSLSGVLIHTMKHEDESGGGRETWNLRTPNGRIAASGVYYFHVVTPDGKTAVGKFTLISVPNN